MTPPLYRAVLDAREELQRATRGGVSVQDIGLRAWDALNVDQRRAALSGVLFAYAERVFDEERARQLDQKAADVTHTYLDLDDVQMLWESALVEADDYEQVVANKAALINVLAELELVQHRLAMRNAE